MAHVAHCPHCEHEFSTPAGADDSGRADCPLCGGSVALLHLREEFRANDQSTTLEFNSLLSDRPAADPDNELTLEAPLEDKDSSATWDDSERMQRLLADIEAQPIDDYLPVVRERGHSPNDETLLDTSNYETEPESDADEPTETSWAPDDAGPADEMSILPASRPTKRRSSILRTLVTTCLAGVIGLALGCYALLWILGPSGDLLKVAKYLPPAMLPASFADQATPKTNTSMAKAPAEITDQRPADKVVATERDNIPIAAKMDAARPTAEVPASFEAPVTTPASEPTTAVGPRYAASANNQAAVTTDTQPSEPARLIDQGVTPFATTTAPAPKLNGAPSYRADQFRAAFAAARDAQSDLVVGDLNDKSAQRTKGMSYSKLCDLAEAATFVADAQASDVADVERFFRETLADNRIRDEVARIVPIWMNSSYRRHGGIFFAGTLAGRVERGPVTECQIELNGGTSLTVLVPPALADRLAALQRSVIVVGSLVDRPSERIADYTGRAPQAVWVSSLISIDR